MADTSVVAIAYQRMKTKEFFHWIPRSLASTKEAGWGLPLPDKLSVDGRPW
ncbi:MAG: hypothetical protein ICV63_04660 [Coleofasciculus sp. Co-bin14]|nr:hypothetical protein [Coleofasciculus sp. Co-bin14]